MTGPKETTPGFDPSFVANLPVTAELLHRGNLIFHPAVARVVLHGSRGPAGGYRESSDVDLSLVVVPAPSGRPELAALLRQVIQTSRAAWTGLVELDLAAVFDLRDCGLRCFEDASQERRCGHAGIDCFGLFKIQKGFSGFVEGHGIRVALIQPCMTIWRRPAAAHPPTRRRGTC